MSQITIEGNLTADPEPRFTPAGVGVAEFSVAENRTFDVNGEQQRRTDFYDVKAWRQLGDNVVASLKKGDRVVVIGRLERRSWEDQATGQTRYRYDLIATSIGASLRFAKVDVTKTAGAGAPVAEAATDAAGSDEPF